MMSPSENRRSRRPYETIPDDATDGDRGRQQPEPHLVHAQPIAGVQDEHRPGRPVRDVEGRRSSAPASASADGRRASGCPRPSRRRGWAARPHLSAGCSMTTRETSTAPSAKHAAFVANGRAIPAANRNAPIGGVRSWFVSRNAPCIRALAMPRSSRATRPGSSVLLAESANVSAVPRTNRATSTTAMLTVADDDRRDEHDEDDGATEVDDDDHPASVEPVGGRAAEDAEQQDRQVLAQQRHRDEERVARLRRDEQRTGRERDAVADVVDDATTTGASGSSRPSRAGARRSRRRRARGLRSPAEDTRPATAGTAHARDGALVERHDAAGQTLPGDVDSPASPMISAIRSGDG